MRHGAMKRIVLSLAVLLATAAYAQQAPQTQTPAQPPSPPPSTPSTTPTPSTAPDPGTTPVAGDTQPSAQPANQSAGQSTQTQDKDKDKKNPAPGTAPVNGDVSPTVNVDPEKVVEPGSQKINVKPGSIDDVSAVGNRDIGGRGLGNWFSTDTEIKMGKAASMDIEKSTKFITDPVVTEYVNRIGQNIVKNSDCKVPFTIKVIDSDEINAMALPGGFFYVNSGLILNADEEAELAGVMAHETAHVCAHHTAREMTRAEYAQIGTIR